jgi:anti-sigma regulatory factor (Ser/Thr protein kinase)
MLLLVSGPSPAMLGDRATRRNHCVGAMTSRGTVAYVAQLIEPAATHACEHVVQFYESDADLIARAGAYLSDGVRGGGVAIVVATEAHRAAFEAHLRDSGVDVAAALEDGTLVSLDAAGTLARFMRDGSVDRDGFFDVIGTVVRAAAATGRPVRAYGEMVALLWDAGDVLGAIDLETLWNELATAVGFSLYCAYRGESVAGHEHADALRRVCHLHSAVVPSPLLETTWRFADDASAPGAARRVLTDALRQAGREGKLLDAAQIVVTELAANAVTHARSSFLVSLRGEGEAVRVAVRDRSHLMPAMRVDPAPMPSGRGLRLVAALSRRWGVDVMADGKVVWAELGP